MKLAVVMTTPEVEARPPVALLTGTFPEKLARAKALGYAGVELMPANPRQLDADSIRLAIAQAGLSVAAVGSGGMAFVAKLTLLHADSDIRWRALELLLDIIRFAGDIGAPLVTIGAAGGRLSSAGPDAYAILMAALRVCLFLG